MMFPFSVHTFRHLYKWIKKPSNCCGTPMTLLFA